MVLGAGALGSLLAAYLTLAEEHVTLIARGEQLAAIRERGLLLSTPTAATHAEAPIRMGFPRGTTVPIPVRAVAASDYDETPDIAFVAVKEYALDQVIPEVARVAGPQTVIVPLLNAVGTGERIAARLPFPDNVAEGLAYVGAERPAPGQVRHNLDFFRIVMGPRQGQPAPEGLRDAADQLRRAGLSVELSTDMLKSYLTKMVRVAALSGALLYVRGTAGDIAASPDALAFLHQLCDEIVEVAAGLGSPLDGDPASELIDLVKTIPPGYRTSLKEDFDNGRPTEIKSQFVDVYALGRDVGVAMPAHEQLLGSLGVVVTGAGGGA
jgi:2-dehydropantoate 2-reductase